MVSKEPLVLSSSILFPKPCPLSTPCQRPSAYRWRTPCSRSNSLASKSMEFSEGEAAWCIVFVFIEETDPRGRRDRAAP